MGLRIATQLIQILLQAGCAFYAFLAWKDIRNNGSRSFWWYIFAGFSLMTLRRITALMLSMGYTFVRPFDVAWIPFVISIFLFIGMRKTYKYTIERDGQLSSNIEKLRELTGRLPKK